MRISFDLDGTLVRIKIINPSIKLPSFLFILLVPFILLAKPNKKIAEELRVLRRGGFIIVVISARPAWAKSLTVWWLNRYQIPFDEVFLVGFGRGTADRKLKIAIRARIDLAFDDNCQVQNILNSSMGIEVISK